MLSKIKSVFSSGPKTAASILALIFAWMLIGILLREDPVLDTPEIADYSSLNEVLVKRIQSEAVHREISILGETRYSRRVVVTALSEGRVVSISNKEGQLVSPKSTLIQIDDRDARAQYQQAKAFEEQKQLEFNGFQKLFDDELISIAKLADARSQLESAKAQKIQKKIQFEGTRVTAPFEGVLQKIMVEQGDYVRKGQELAEVLDFSPFVITGEVSERESVYIEQGLKAKARLIDGRVFHGTISYKSARAETESRSFSIELSVENQDNQNILSGISSTILIPVNHAKAHKLASSALEIDDSGEFGVKVIDDENMVSFLPVTILKSSQDGVWVKGLPDTVNVIVRGQGFVKPGEFVKAVYENTQIGSSLEKENDKNKQIDLSQQNPK